MGDETGRAWYRGGAVYQIYPRSFQDSDGDGVGDLPGIIRRLDYIESLGVSAVWLCPIYASPNDDNGYDISDYRAIQPEFGTMDDFDELVEGLHRRGLRLIMDMVLNHTSDEHPWFREAKEDPSSPKRAWYIWRRGTEGGAPSRWASFFGGSAWELEPESGEYYLHLFTRKQPDLNWESPGLRRELHEMMRWWLAKGVDGFRLDAINLVSKPRGLPEGRPIPGTDYTWALEHWVNGPRIHEYMHELNEKVFAPFGAVTVGETPGVDPDLAAAYTDPARRELDMIFQFEMTDFDIGPRGKFAVVPMDRAKVVQICRRWQEGSSRGWNSLFWGNHDQPRAISRYGNDGEARELSGKALAAFLYLQKGTPFIYQGEEIGMVNYPFERESDLRDVESLNFVRRASASGDWTAESIWSGIRARGRDNARTPMCWSAGSNAGFTTVNPWIAVHPRYREINVEDSERRPDSLLAFYRRLLQLRRREPLVSEGGIEFVDGLPGSLALYRRWSPTSRNVLWVGCNLSPDEIRLGDDAPRPLGLTALATHGQGTSQPVWRPWEARVWYEPASSIP